MMQGDQDMNNDMSYDDVCAIGWKGYKAGKGAGKKGPFGPGARHREMGAGEWTSGRKDDGGKQGGKKGAKGSKPDWYGDKGKRGSGNKGNAVNGSCWNCGVVGHRQSGCPGLGAMNEQQNQDKRGKNKAYKSDGKGF